MRKVLGAVVIAAMAGSFALAARAADLDRTSPLPPASEGVACAFEDWGPTIDLPWPSVWLGHFAGGRFVESPTGPQLAWQNEKVCFPSRASCYRWIRAQKRLFHRPEGDFTCLPIR